MWEALKRTFPRNNNLIANKILSLAYYIVLNKQNTMHYYDVFAECTKLPFQKAMSEASISRLFASINSNDKSNTFDLSANFGQTA